MNARGEQRGSRDVQFSDQGEAGDKALFRIIAA
jgi:hypothetical protein